MGKIRWGIFMRLNWGKSIDFDNKTAIEEDLPIGSGEIESAHRYIIQKRLKTAGAWWKKNNAEYMLAMRVCRANDEWDSYWDRIAA